MNITKQNIDELNATLTIQVAKPDYEERVNKVLKDYRRKANIPGFRPGNVPMGLINKMYGKAVLADELNKMVSESINDYIKNESLHILGDPLPNANSITLDLDNNTEFEFIFDLAIAPQFDVNISKKDKVTAYQITADDKMVQNYVSSYTRRYGRFIEADSVSGNEMIKGQLDQIDENGKLVEAGHTVEDVSIYLDIAKDEDEKKAFIGAKVGDIVKFNVKKAFPNDFEISNLLKIDKDKVAEAASTFQITIHSISKFEDAEMNTELFDKVYGEGVVATEEEFIEKIKSELRAQLAKDEDYKFTLDARAFMLKKTNMSLPTEFLKRWVMYMNEGKLTAEQVEKDFPVFEEDMKWQLIKNKVSKDNNFEVKEEEVIEAAKQTVLMQFRQYGINNVPDEQLQMYAVNMLKKEADVRRLIDRVMEEKVIAYIKENAGVEVKEISNEDFAKLFN